MLVLMSRHATWVLRGSFSVPCQGLLRVRRIVCAGHFQLQVCEKYINESVEIFSRHGQKTLDWKLRHTSSFRGWQQGIRGGLWGGEPWARNQLLGRSQGL